MVVSIRAAVRANLLEQHARVEIPALLDFASRAMCEAQLPERASFMPRSRRDH
jgi:hypothetical protein